MKTYEIELIPAHPLFIADQMQLEIQLSLFLDYKYLLFSIACAMKFGLAI